MSSQCYSMNRHGNASDNGDAKPSVSREKVMSYEEKSVGSTSFFKCEACPYMALAEDDIKFHLFTVHPDLAKSNGLAENIQIPCPGCTSVFDAEETLRNHLRSHHKMGIKDIKKMIKSLVQIALKNAKLKKESQPEALPPLPRQDIADVTVPQVIEIGPDIKTNEQSLPKGVAFISVDELNKMSMPNFEKKDPKEIIQEASINIVYTNDTSTQFVKVGNPGPLNASCGVLKVSSVTPDLISSIPHVSKADSTCMSPQSVDSSREPILPLRKEPITPLPPPVGRPMGSLSSSFDEDRSNMTEEEIEEKLGKMCSIDNCHFRLKNPENLAYHRKCHQNGILQCPECSKLCHGLDILHTHLWKIHAIDMELPTCEICGFKTYKKYRLYNIHMKIHGNLKSHHCPNCPKSFKTSCQLTKHKQVHKKVECSICHIEFNQIRLKSHMSAVHEKIKPFKCCHCDYTTGRKEEMKRHLRSHTGDKPYSCDQCMYRSADHNSMRRHKKVHGNQTMYHCKYCSFSTIQSTTYTSHMISKHPNVTAKDIHRCPYCPFKSVNKDNYVVHLSSHTDKDGIKLLIEMSNVKAKPSWTIPSPTSDKLSSEDGGNDHSKDADSETVGTIDVETYDCDSLSEGLPQDYSKPYTTVPNNVQDNDYSNEVVVQDLSKDDNTYCLLSESSNDTMMERHQYAPQLQLSYENGQGNLHGFLNTNVSLEQNLLQNSNVNSLVTSHSSIGTNNIMSNFPIRLPMIPQTSVQNNITLKPVDKISIPLTTKVTGPIIKPTQILPIPSASNSPVNISSEQDGATRKKPKISVKSNLILKGPDQVNMFHSQQKMAFRRLEDNQRFGLAPVTFNNLITTQFMQLQPQPTLSESPNNIISYPQETMCDTSTTPVDNGINDTSQIFSFNQQMNVNQMTILPPPQKIQTNDPSYIKLEATIKQNTQSPSLERMCNANLLVTPAMSREYKASPPLEDIHKNMNEIKNEVKSDAYYITLNNNGLNPSMVDQYLIDNIIGEQYSGLMDLDRHPAPEISDDQQNDVIEIDDNSDDNKLLNFPLESLYLMHTDFHFLENEVPNMPTDLAVNEINRMVAEVPIINQKESMEVPIEPNTDFPNFIQGKKDPMMNTSVKPTTNKINVKNIELMKN